MQAIFDKFADKVSYAVAQLERGEQGTLHWQGYVEFKIRTKLGTCKNYIPGAHWEKRRGTREQAREYCLKEDSREPDTEQFVHGVWDGGSNGRGKMDTKYAAMYDMVKAGATDLEIANAYPALYARSLKAIDRLRAISTPPRSEKTKVIVMVGPTGTGKTHTAMASSSSVYIKEHGEWWDGYRGQEVVIIDEFYGWMPLSFMLRLMDKYPMQVPVKGGFAQFTSKTIFITSNKPVSQWYTSEKIHKAQHDAFYRRIDEFRLCLNQNQHNIFVDRGSFELMANQSGFA